MVDAKIRRASPSDVAAIERIVHAAFEMYVTRIGRQPAPMVADYAAAALSANLG